MTAATLHVLEGRELVFIGDHRDTLLSNARRFRKEKSNELASVFYATSIEHTVNFFIHRFAERKGFTTPEIDSIIRESSMRSKTTWLLRALDGKSFTKLHVNRINKLMEFRNSYIHYKWKPINEEAEKELDRALEQTLDQIERTLKYLVEYQTKYLNRFTARKLRRLQTREALNEIEKSDDTENTGQDEVVKTK